MASAYAYQLGFAAGILAAIPIGGVNPIRFGVLQDASLEYTPELRPLYGQNRFAIALAPGKTKVAIKSKFAAIRAAAYYELFFQGGTNTSLTAGTETRFQDSELQTVAGTVTVTNAAHFIQDWGVFYSATGVPFTAVASGPAVGQYSVNDATGVYTFNAGDAGAQVYISYTWTLAAGNLIAFGNPQMGTGPVFSAVLAQPFDGRQQVWTFNRCTSSRLMIPTKLDDWIINEFDFEISQDIAGNLGTVSTDL